MTDIIRIGVSPWSYLRPECFPTSKTGCGAGVEMDILEMFSNMANLKVELVLTDVTGCGTISESKKSDWTGLYKMLLDGKIDITGNLCTINKFGNFKQDIFTVGWPLWQYQEEYVIQAPKPPPTSFSPFACFKTSVWLAYGFLVLFILVLSLWILYIILPNGVRNLWDSIKITCDPSFAGFQRYPLSHIWTPYILLLTSVVILYRTFIMSAILYPFPIWKPFSTTNELVDTLSTCRYKLLSYKTPSLTSCADQCALKFKESINRCNFTIIPGGTGYQLLSTIAYQKDNDDPRFVLNTGAPFISLYLDEFRQDRDRLWVIDGDATFTWSSFLIRKNFSHTEKLNRYIRSLGDFRDHILARYIRPQGGEPHRSDTITDKADLKAISIEMLQGLFFFYLCGIATGLLGLAIEIWRGQLAI